MSIKHYFKLENKYCPELMVFSSDTSENKVTISMISNGMSGMVTLTKSELGDLIVALLTANENLYIPYDYQKISVSTS